MAAPRLTVAAATRPHAGEAANGDGWQVDWAGDRCRVVIIDGLGHGPVAAAATQVASRVLTAHPELLPEQALRACHAALGGTRGAAMSVASIDVAAGHLTYAGVGNAEAYLLRNGRSERLVAYRGIVGGIFPRLRVFSYSLEPGWLLLLHTDGVRARFQVDALTEHLRADPQAMADSILQTWGRATDDATVVVVRAAESENSP
jgi:serine phosphatase RsbU (regulator of sigma subunit)